MRGTLRLLCPTFATKLIPRGCKGGTAVHAGGTCRGDVRGEHHHATLAVAFLDKVVEVLVLNHLQPLLRVFVGVVNASGGDHDKRDARKDEGQTFDRREEGSLVHAFVDGKAVHLKRVRVRQLTDLHGEKQGVPRDFVVVVAKGIQSLRGGRRRNFNDLWGFGLRVKGYGVIGRGL